MTLDSLHRRDLIQCLNTQYYYIKYSNEEETGYNFFFCLFDLNNKVKLAEPIELSTLLIELSPKVRNNNTFAGVARSLKLPESIINESLNIDKSICNSIFNKGRIK